MIFNGEMINKKINGKFQEKINKGKRKKKKCFRGNKKEIEQQDCFVQKFNSFIDSCSMKKKKNRNCSIVCSQKIDWFG